MKEQFKAALQYFRENSEAFFAPLALALAGVIVLWLLARYTRRWYSQLSLQEPALEKDSSFFRLFLVNHSSLVNGTILWLFRFGLFLCAMFLLQMLLAPLSEVVGSVEQKALWSEVREWVRETRKLITYVFLVVLGGYWTALIMSGVMAAVITRTVKTRNPVRAEVRAATLESSLKYLINLTIIVIVLLNVLQRVGLDIRPLLATAGVVTFAVGFGAQTLIKDVLGGFFILLEDQYGVGDSIEVAGKKGRVESMNLRVTRLRGESENLLIIPNGDIRVVENLSRRHSQPHL